MTETGAEQAGRKVFGPRTCRLGSAQAQKAAVEWAGTAMAAGAVVVYPTETLYGLGADPKADAAVRRIYRIKGRDFDKPLPFIAADLAAVQRVVAMWPEPAARLAEAFWPGPLTLVLPAAATAPRTLHAGTGRIGIRVSSHPVAVALAKAVGGLVTATSANPAGGEPPISPDDIPTELLDRVDGVLDGGRAPGRIPSTVVEIGLGEAQATLRVLREGSVPLEAIRRVVAGTLTVELVTRSDTSREPRPATLLAGDR